ncbi:MAG: glycosyl hydrolase, partial [Bacteroidota bacterium]
CTVYAFAESPAKEGVLWAGSDDGLIHLSTDDGKSWNDVTPKDLLPWSTVSIIEPSHFDAGTCFFAAHRYRLDDTRPYIYRTTDYGKTWTLITKGLPANVNTRCVREDPNRKELLYAGTETGAYISFNNGDAWQSMQLNLPVTPVHDMQVKKDLKDLVIATHGRGFWVLDDLTPFYQINDSIINSDYWLYEPNVAIRMDGKQLDAEKDESINKQVGTNAPNGVIVDYYLKEKPKGEIKLIFYSANGDSIITFSNKFDKYGEPLKKKENFYEDPKHQEEILPVDTGMNRFVWNLAYPDVKHFEEEYWAASSLAGPRALPGNYVVKLMKGDTLLMKRNFSIVLNPKVKTNTADLKAQFDLMMQVNKKQNEIIRGVLQIRGVQSQVNNFIGSFSDSTKIISLKKVAKPLLDSLQAIGDTLINSKVKANEDVLRYPMQLFERYCSLQDFIRGSDTKPTEQEVKVLEELNMRTAPELKRLQSVFDKQIPAFNSAVKQLDLNVVDPGRAIKE